MKDSVVIKTPQDMTKFSFLFDGLTTERFVVFVLSTTGRVQAIDIVGEECSPVLNTSAQDAEAQAPRTRRLEQVLTKKVEAIMNTILIGDIEIRYNVRQESCGSSYYFDLPFGEGEELHPTLAGLEVEVAGSPLHPRWGSPQGNGFRRLYRYIFAPSKNAFAYAEEQVKQTLDQLRTALERRA